ncbi:MAG: holo-ACP synthase [Planctomycetes bacterium]|nr:holo-ACP synthase [Planctomycetota bacterium]
MNVVAHGIDLVETARVAEVHQRHGRRFLDRVFTPGEQAYCLDRKRMYEHLAARFAAKEAVLKALGTGWRDGIAWTDVEVVNSPAGAPSVRLAGQCARLAAERGLSEILISITHTEAHAMASAIALGGQTKG